MAACAVTEIHSYESCTVYARGECHLFNGLGKNANIEGSRSIFFIKLYPNLVPFLT